MNDFIFDIEVEGFKGFRGYVVYIAPLGGGEFVRYGAYATKREAKRVVTRLEKCDNETIQKIYESKLRSKEVEGL
jgi:hypothetical protein